MAIPVKHTNVIVTIFIIFSHGNSVGLGKNTQMHHTGMGIKLHTKARISKASVAFQYSVERKKVCSSKGEIKA